jgi:hypothetical protein
VLAVGIDLDRMSITPLSGVSQTGEHGIAFAAISAVAKQSNHPGESYRQLVKCRGARFGAAVIHEYAC